MTLQFGSFETLVTFLAVLVANFIIQDGESNWLEGLVPYFLLTMRHQTLEDGTVTLRERDSKGQSRVSVEDALSKVRR
jgi:hypothetical protein